MANKYGAVKTRGYDSKKEAQRADELRLLERAGEISELQEQVRFELIPPIYETPDGEWIVVSDPYTMPPNVPHVTAQEKLTSYAIKKKGLWCVERPCAYVADFVYKDTSGRTVVEDVKSQPTKTQEYVIKRKLLLWRYGLRIKEV